MAESNNHNVRISIIMPVHNGERYISDAIKSVLNQTFKDFEFIIINDFSNDKTLEIIKSFNDPRIITINNSVQLGVAKSLNIALNETRGQYIARMDADDVCLPYRLERQYIYMKKNTKIDICGSFAYRIDSESKLSKNIWKEPTSDGEIKAIMLFSCPLIHPTVFFRKETFTKHKLKYNEDYTSAQDYELWSRVMDYVIFANIDEPLLFYRIHSDSITGNKLETQKVNSQKIRDYLFNKFEITGEPIDDSLLNTEKWLLSVCDNSKLREYCSKEAIRNTFDKIWFAKCLENISGGWSIYKIYFTSKLRQNTPKSIVKTIFLLFKLLHII